MLLLIMNIARKCYLQPTDNSDISNFKLRKKSKEIVRLIIVKANFYKNSIYFFTTSSTLFPYTDFNRGNFNPCIQIRCKIKAASESCFSCTKNRKNPAALLLINPFFFHYWSEKPPKTQNLGCKTN